MGNYLWTDKPSQYITIQLSLPSMSPTFRS